MASDFGFIKDVKDSDFNEKLKDLYGECLKIVDFQTEHPADCVMNIRTQNERLVKYLYTRLTGKRKEKIIDILKDKKFKAAVNNATLINSADRLRFDGNLVVHREANDPVPIDVVMAAETGVPTFVWVVRRVCEMVDTLPPVSHSSAIQNTEEKPYISGQVSVSIKEPTNSGETRRYLEATVDGCNVSRTSELRYKWYKTNPKTELQRGKDNRFFLPPQSTGDAYFCVVTSTETFGKLRSKYYRDNASAGASGAQTDINTSPKMPASKAAQEPQKAPMPIVEDGTAKGSVTKTTIQNKGLRTAEQPSDANRQTTSPSLSKLLPLAKTVVYPLPSPDMPKLFDPINGLVHYFIRPNDKFVLNSLELIGADACLHRLLKQEGFEQIAFLEVEHEEWLINTYDAYSKDIINVKKLKQQFSWEIRKALENKQHKTAIVVPLSAFEWEPRRKNDMIDAISKIGVENGENILVLTTTYRTDITRCFAEQIWRVHGWLPEGVEAVENKSVEVIQGLQERRLIVLADEYYVDEIANLLLRKKLVDGSGILKELPASKVYGLADLLLKHCLQIKDYFRQIPYQNRRDGCIRQLNALLDDTRVQEELVTVAERLEPSAIGHSDKLDSLFLERLYHIDANRYKKSAPAASPKTFPRKRQKKLPQDLFKNLPDPYQPEERKREELLPTVGPAVLFITAQTCRDEPNYGTGFLIHPDGYALTCNHVIDGARQVEARLRTTVSNDYVDTWYPCEVVYGDPVCDMAVLKLCEPGAGINAPQAGRFPYLLMASKSRVIAYDEEYILPGYPYGMKTAGSMTVLDGRIANSEPDKDELTYDRWSLTNRAFEGNSGSPIISLRDSRVIGLLMGAIGGKQGLDFMRPIRYFWLDFLQ